MTPRLQTQPSAAHALALAVLALAMLAALVAHGAPPQPNNRPTVRIRAQLCNGSRCVPALTSGTLIGGLPDQRFAVLTCAHGLDPNSTQPPAVEILPGNWTEAQILARDRRADLALLAVRYSGRLNVIPLAETEPPIEAALRVSGFPRGQAYRSRPTRLVRVVESDGLPLAVTDAPFISGESGGTVSTQTPNGEALVGVIVGTDFDTPGEQFLPPGFRPDRDGYVVPWSTISPFVLTAAGEPPRTSPAAGEAQPYRRSPTPAPAPQPEGAQLGEPTPAEGAIVVIRPPAKQEPATAPDEPDWSLVRLVVVVPRQAALDPVDGLVRIAERLSAADAGPGKTVRRWLNETTAGKADIDIVYERIEPTRFAAVIEASGLRPGKYAGVVALVKKQDSGLLSPLKTLAARIAERAAERRLPDVPVEVVLERTAAADFGEIVDALATPEPAAADPPAASGNWLELTLAAVYAALKGFRRWAEARTTT